MQQGESGTNYLVLKEKNHQPRVLYPMKSSNSDGEIKSLSDKQKLMEFVTIQSALQEVLKSFLERKKMI